MITKSVKKIIEKLKDPLNIIIFTIVFVLFFSPVWVGCLLFFLTENAVHLSYVGGWITFWSLPFTPALAIILLITVWVRKIIDHLINKNSKK